MALYFSLWSSSSDQTASFVLYLGKSVTETRKMLVIIYGREVSSHKCGFELFKGFREGLEDLRGDSNSGGAIKCSKQEEG